LRFFLRRRKRSKSSARAPFSSIESC
jgi:hypothetical protein